MAVLILESQDSDERRQTHHLKTADETQIGRHPNCDVVTASHAVSRFHARITEDSGSYTIEDLSSRNGTRVNGAQIHEATILTDGDVIQICDIEYIFQLSNAEFFRSLPDVLQGRYVNIHAEPLATQLAKELSDPKSGLRSRLEAGFRKVVVLDAEHGGEKNSPHSLDTFLRHAWDLIAQELDLPRRKETFHSSSIPENLEREKPILICVTNIQHFTEDEISSLRAHFIDPGNHHILYVGYNPNLGVVSAPPRHNSDRHDPDDYFRSGETHYDTVLSDSSIIRPSMRRHHDSDFVLQAVLELMQRLHDVTELELIYSKALEFMLELFPSADFGAIFVKDDSTEPGTLQILLTRTGNRETGNSGLASRSVLQRVVDSGRPQIIRYVPSDEQRFPETSLLAFRMISSAYVPLTLSGQRGRSVVLLSSHQMARGINEDDLTVLEPLANVLSGCVSNALLAQMQTADSIARRELELAAQIARGFLPDDLPDIANYDVATYYQASDVVGADFFTYSTRDEHRILFAIGDVAGKGVSAALLMAKLSSAVSMAVATFPTLPEIMHAVNGEVIRGAGGQRFVTLLIAELDVQSHELTIVNAGHLPLVVRRHDGTMESFGSDQAGLPVGIIDEATYEAETLSINSGDRILMETDGVGEALDDRQKMFGWDRINQIIESQNGSSSELIDALLEEVRTFTSGNWPQDDVCMIALHRTA